MRKALIYMNCTGDEKVDDLAINTMKQYCEANDMEVIVAFGEDTQMTGLSQPGFFTCVGMAATDQIDVVVTMMAEMISSEFDDIMNALGWFRQFGVDVETLNDDIEDYYDLIYEAEEAEEMCCDCEQTDNLMELLQQKFKK